MTTFGKHKRSDIHLKKTIRKGNKSEVLIKINDQSLSLTVNDLNIYNVLSSIAVLKELGLNTLKLKSKFNT